MRGAQKKVLFVCLGNICRSPAAEGVFREMVKKAGLEDKIHVDSAGTGAWHEGDSPDGRMTDHAKQRGYDLSDLIARQILYKDLQEFDYVLTMDDSNLRNTKALDLKGEHHTKIRPLLTYARKHTLTEVPDPYYKAGDGFELVLDLLEDACSELLEEIKKEIA